MYESILRVIEIVIETSSKTEGLTYWVNCGGLEMLPRLRSADLAAAQCELRLESAKVENMGGFASINHMIGMLPRDRYSDDFAIHHRAGYIRTAIVSS